MADIMQQGRTFLRAFLFLGAILLWVQLNQPPDALESARRVVDGALFPFSSNEYTLDPLAGAPGYIAKPLSQYRFEYKAWPAYDQEINRSKRESLAEVSVAAVVYLGKQVFAEHEPAGRSPLSELYVSHYRRELGRLQSWQNQTALGEYATLGDLNAALETNLTVPLIEQPIKTKTIVALSALGLVVLHLLLHSLLGTAQKLCTPAEARELTTWLPLQPNPIGVWLTFACIAAPCGLWVAHTTLQPLLQQQLPSWYTFASDAFLLGVTAWTWHRLLRFRSQIQGLVTAGTETIPLPASALVRVASPSLVREAA